MVARRPGGHMRSLLFVPGNDQKKLLKAATILADGLILDWEDSVLPKDRRAARVLTTNFLRESTQRETKVFVRINRMGSRDFEEDCQALMALSVDGIVLSKCNSREDIEMLAKVLDRKNQSSHIRIHALIESAAGLLNAPSIAATCSRVASLIFGSEDYCSDVGVSRTPGEIELLFARSALVVASKAFRIEAIDSPCLDFKDNKKLRDEAQAARNLGFTGKLAIHPDQVGILNEVFSPTEAEVEDARRILASSSSSGTAVLTVNGGMVDEAVLRRARQILRRRKIEASRQDDGK